MGRRGIQAARALAEKLDTVRASNTAAAASAAPALARQLLDTIADLRGLSKEPTPLEDILRRRDAKLITLHAQIDAA